MSGAYPNDRVTCSPATQRLLVDAVRASLLFWEPVWSQETEAEFDELTGCNPETMIRSQALTRLLRKALDEVKR